MSKTSVILHPIRGAEATQIACRLVEAHGGQINSYRLTKLLYLVERETWIRTGGAAMGGTYFSFEDGPAISETTDAANQERNLREWSEHLEQVRYSEQGTAIKLVRAAGRDDLSDAVLKTVDEIIKKTRGMKDEELKAYCHKLAEFKAPPKRGRIPISAEEILSAGGWGEKQIASLQQERSLWQKLEAAIA